MISLNLRFDIRMVESEFGINNMKVWINVMISPHFGGII